MTNPTNQRNLDDLTVCVKCPTCNGKGTVALGIDDVQRLALKGRAK